MPADSAIEVRTGESRWLRTSRHALFVLAVVALALAPAQALWKGASAACLLLVYGFVILSVRRSARVRSLRLLANGAVTLTSAGPLEQHGVLGTTHWASDLLTVVTVSLYDRRRAARLVVCRSLNHPDDYRRLLVKLRLGTGRRGKNGILSRA